MAPRLFARVAPPILMLAALAPPQASAGESYYVLLFGSQDHPKHLRNTHTWATFVRAIGDGADPAAYQLHVHTISWYPATLDVHVWRPWPEAGINMTLEQTLQVVLAQNQQVRLWGPFVINAALYDRSVSIYHQLQSGRYRYRAISGLTDEYLVDCIHAVAAVDPRFGRDHYPLVRIGFSATRFMAREVMVRQPLLGIDQTAYDNSWLIPALGLDRYPIRVIPPQRIPARRCLLCLHPD